jgi:hypothetical protein
LASTALRPPNLDASAAPVSTPAATGRGGAGVPSNQQERDYGREAAAHPRISKVRGEGRTPFCALALRRTPPP